jgi:hypothetical protein
MTDKETQYELCRERSIGEAIRVTRGLKKEIDLMTLRMMDVIVRESMMRIYQLS